MRIDRIITTLFPEQPRESLSSIHAEEVCTWAKLCAVGFIAEVVTTCNSFETEGLCSCIEFHINRWQRRSRKDCREHRTTIIIDLIDLLHITRRCALDEDERHVDKFLLITCRQRNIVAKQRSKVRYIILPTEAIRPEVETNAIWSDVSTDLEVHDRIEVRRENLSECSLSCHDRGIHLETGLIVRVEFPCFLNKECVCWDRRMICSTRTIDAWLHRTLIQHNRGSAWFHCDVYINTCCCCRNGSEFKCCKGASSIRLRHIPHLIEQQTVACWYTKECSHKARPSLIPCDQRIRIELTAVIGNEFRVLRMCIGDLACHPRLDRCFVKRRVPHLDLIEETLVGT